MVPLRVPVVIRDLDIHIVSLSDEDLSTTLGAAATVAPVRNVEIYRRPIVDNREPYGLSSVIVTVLPAPMDLHFTALSQGRIRVCVVFDNHAARAEKAKFSPVRLDGEGELCPVRLWERDVVVDSVLDIISAPAHGGVSRVSHEARA